MIELWDAWGGPNSFVLLEVSEPFHAMVLKSPGEKPPPFTNLRIFAAAILAMALPWGIYGLFPTLSSLLLKQFVWYLQCGGIVYLRATDGSGGVFCSGQAGFVRG